MNTPKEFAQQPSEPRYLNREDEYRHDNPEVRRYEKFFSDRTEHIKIFANISPVIEFSRSQLTAELMASTWDQFSRHVPKFLLNAAAKSSDPARQHQLIQIAFDELGGQDRSKIHSVLFGECIGDIGVKFTLGSPSIRFLLDSLDEILAHAKSEASVFGLLLSFEIPAMQNISTLFECLAYDAAAREKLAASPFFTIHFADETEHIRHSIANFLRFCPTEADRVDFMCSFDEGIAWWAHFWDQASRLINVANPRSKAA